LNIFDRELSPASAGKTISAAKHVRLTDYRAEDKDILRSLVFAGGGSARRLRQAGRTVVARRQILFHATTFYTPV
jgi:hypothetical protein